MTNCEARLLPAAPAGIFAKSVAFGSFALSCAAVLITGCGDSASSGDASARGDAALAVDAGALDATTDGATSDAVDRYLPAFSPGTRLEVRAVGLPGSPVFFRTFYDTSLEVECTFAPAIDGTLRCMPQWELDQIGIRFADSSCAEPRYYPTRDKCAAREYHVITRDEDRGCDLGRVLEVVRLTPLPSAPTRGYARNSDGSCTDSGAFPSTAAFEGADVAPTDFVAGDIVNLGGATTPGVRVLEAEDGARLILQAYDARHDLGCVPFSFEGTSSQRCLTTPAPRIDPWWYSDMACTEQLAWTDKRPSTCVPPAFGTRGGELMRVGTERTTVIYQQSGGMCIDATPADHSLWTIYDVPGAASVDDLYEIAFTSFGSGNLSPYFATDPDGTLLVLQSLWDSNRGHPCEPRVLSDDSLACVATRVARRENFFADAGCTEPVVLTTLPAPDALVAEEFSQCPLAFRQQRVTAVWSVGAEFAGRVYQQRSGTCETYSPTGEERVFRIGAEVSDSLPILEDQTVALP